MHSKKQSSRIIEALGLNPQYDELINKKRSKISSDPNIVFFDIECGGDKVGGARDMLEVKVNQSQPLFINTRNQTHFSLQYSNYTGLISCLNDPGHFNKGTSYQPPNASL